MQTKHSDEVPLGLLHPIPVPESRFSLWSIDFIADLPLSHKCKTILTCVDYLIKNIIIIPCKICDKILTAADIVQLFLHILYDTLAYLK